MNSYSRVRVGIAGATGYAGVELLRRLAQHPNATRSWTTVLHVPVAKTVRAAKGAKSARVTFEVTATDEAGRGDVPVSCSPESGSRFPLGETTVNCVAMGSKGMTGAAFTVTVKRRR